MPNVALTESLITDEHLVEPPLAVSVSTNGKGEIAKVEKEEKSVADLGKLGKYCQELINHFNESKADARSRADGHCAACDANIDYLRTLARAAYEAEKDLASRFDACTSTAKSMLTEFTAMRPFAK